MPISVNIGADRLLEWLFKEKPSPTERRELELRRELLLKEFQVDDFEWLSLRRLARAIALDPEQPVARDATSRLLISLPAPGPARPSRKRHDGEPAEERWGLVTVVGP